MLRGAQKQMIVVRTRDSRLFEAAYFVVRRPCTGKQAGVNKDDMLWEANRIIEKSVAAAGPTITGETNRPAALPLSLHRGRFRWLWFTLGTICGGSLVGLLWFFL
jgi:hypothetical protein